MSSWSFVPRFPFLHSFCSHGNMFACSRCSYNSSAKIPVSNFRNRGTHVMDLKFATAFPFSNSFTHSNVISSDHPLGHVIFLETPVKLKCYVTMQITQILYPIPLNSIRTWAFPIWHFSHLLLQFRHLNVYVILHP